MSVGAVYRSKQDTQGVSANQYTANQLDQNDSISSAQLLTAKPLQSCLTLCDPIPGILQARTLEWVAISFSNA